MHNSVLPPSPEPTLPVGHFAQTQASSTGLAGSFVSASSVLVTESTLPESKVVSPSPDSASLMSHSVSLPLLIRPEAAPTLAERKVVSPSPHSVSPIYHSVSPPLLIRPVSPGIACSS